MTVAQRVPESSIAGRVAVLFAQALQESLQILQDSRRARELGLRLTPRGFGGWLSLGGVRQAFDRLAQLRALGQELVHSFGHHPALSLKVVERETDVANFARDAQQRG